VHDRALHSHLHRQRKAGDEKWIVRGRGQGDRLIQVIFVEDLEGNDTLFVIHAMPVSTRRRRR
jgi:hypothetical protein